MNQRDGSPNGSGVAVRADLVDRYGLTPMQHGLLFESAHGGHPGVNVQQVVVRLPEALDVEALRSAWRLAQARHDALRTRFVWRGKLSPVQEVYANGALD
ncbi:MAG: hypothetical protein KC593_01530, partial [Myxococcales bacterium]|nr:hypothetical protein [Myxococcales bacterium]